MTSRRSALALALAAFLLPTASRADDPIQLKFGFANPPSTWINAIGIAGWAKDVEKRTDGKLTVQVFAGGTVVNQRNVYDRLLNGVVDAAYGPFGAISDQMPRVDVTNLPFEAPNIVTASAATWRLYKAGLFDEDFRRIHILTTFCLPPTGLHTTKAVSKLEDLRGLKISSATRANGEVAERLGGTVVSFSNPDVYGALQRGMAQGIMLPDAGIVTFSLQEVTKYHISLAFGCTSAGFFMNKDSYAKLPGDARAAIDAASSDELAKFMAAASHDEDQIARSKIAATPGAVMVSLDAQEIARWHERLKPITEEWTRTVPDGAAVLAAFRAEIAKLRSGS